MDTQLNYMEQLQGLGEVKPTSGTSSDPFPTGWYPFKVVKAEATVIEKTGVPIVRLQLGLKEGHGIPGFGGRIAFVDMFLGQGRTGYEDGHEVMLTPEKFKEELVKTQAKAAGFLLALTGMTPDLTAIGSTAESVGRVYRVPTWEGREVMGRLAVIKDKTGQYGDKNRLMEWASIDDAKHGFAQWQTAAWGLKKVTAAIGKPSGSNGAGSVGATV